MHHGMCRFEGIALPLMPFAHGILIDPLPVDSPFSEAGAFSRTKLSAILRWASESPPRRGHDTARFRFFRTAPPHRARFISPPAYSRRVSPECPNGALIRRAKHYSFLMRTLPLD